MHHPRLFLAFSGRCATQALASPGCEIQRLHHAGQLGSARVSGLDGVPGESWAVMSVRRQRGRANHFEAQEVLVWTGWDLTSRGAMHRRACVVDSRYFNLPYEEVEALHVWGGSSLIVRSSRSFRLPHLGTVLSSSSRSESHDRTSRARWVARICRSEFGGLSEAFRFGMNKSGSGACSWGEHLGCGMRRWMWDFRLWCK